MEKIFGRIISQIPLKKSIEDALIYIRSYNFHFISPDILSDLYPEGFFLKPSHKKYQILVRELKELRYLHLNKEYDLRLYFAIKMWGKKNNKIHIYYEGKYLSTVKLSWAKNVDMNFRKTIKRWKFPDYLTYEQRRTWRAEHRKVINPNSPYKGSEWYHNCLKDIIYTEQPK